MSSIAPPARSVESAVRSWSPMRGWRRVPSANRANPSPNELSVEGTFLLILSLRLYPLSHLDHTTPTIERTSTPLPGLSSCTPTLPLRLQCRHSQSRRRAKLPMSSPRRWHPKPPRRLVTAPLTGTARRQSSNLTGRQRAISPHPTIPYRHKGDVGDLVIRGELPKELDGYFYRVITDAWTPPHPQTAIYRPSNSRMARSTSR